MNCSITFARDTFKRADYLIISASLRGYRLNFEISLFCDTFYFNKL